MVGAGALSMPICSSGKLGVRIRKALLFGLIASLPILVWLIWTYFTSAHSLGGRSLGLDWNGLAVPIQDFPGIIYRYRGKVGTLPEQPSGPDLSFTVCPGGRRTGRHPGAFYMGDRSPAKKADTGEHRSDLPIFSYFGLSAFFLVVVLLLTYLFTRPTIDIDNRTLLPFFVCSVITFSGHLRSGRLPSPVIKKLASLKTPWSNGWQSALRQTVSSKGWNLVFQGLAWLVAAACLAWYIPQAQNMVTLYHKGDGLTAYRWGRSEIIQTVSSLPDTQPVISNDWQLLLLWTGRPIYGIWVSFPKTRPIQTTPLRHHPR